MKHSIKYVTYTRIVTSFHICLFIVVHALPPVFRG